MQNYKLTIGYDGRRYTGFNTYKDETEKSIQGKLESILKILYETPVEVIGAVNTDAGVHAKAQIVNFVAPTDKLDADGIFEYIEKYLPDDIVVYTIDAVDERFHSRYNVSKITYEYRLWKNDAPNRPLFERQYVNVMNQNLSVQKMKTAIADFLGEHDFSAFTTHKKTKNPIKCIYDLDVEETVHEIIVSITANNFLPNMERLIVGTLIQTGLGQLPPNTVSKALKTQSANAVGHKVMAGALCLTKITFK